jgi:hypothetical protein
VKNIQNSEKHPKQWKTFKTVKIIQNSENHSKQW